MKKFILTLCLISALFLCGCRNRNNGFEFIDSNTIAPTEVQKQTFNDESYIWENFIFPVNKTETK
jgi:uncharacterized lipoprotein NlpE involved in copper resistance